jgi:hypothetical protein
LREKFNQSKKVNQKDMTSLVKNSLDESELNLAAVRDVYIGYFCEINCTGKTNDYIIDEIAVI